MIALVIPSIRFAVLYAFLGIAMLVVTGWGILTEHDYRLSQMRVNRPLLPIWGRFPAISIIETATGSATLDANGVYQVKAEHTLGTLTFFLQLVETDEDRLLMYRKKYDLLRLEDICFHTGFVTLQVTDKIQFENNNTSKLSNPIQLKGCASDLPLLTDAPYNKQWECQHKYHLILNNPHTSGLPVQIVPSLLSEGDEWGLELYVQVNLKSENSVISMPKVAKLSLETPGSCGRVEHHIPSAQVTYGTLDQSKITWQNVNLSPVNPFIASGNFFVRFSNSREIKPDVSIEGELYVEFEGTISGLTSIARFSPFGRDMMTEDASVDHRSKVNIAFQFNLAALCLRRFYPVTESIEQLAMIPGNEMITRLVNAMSEKDIYVQRVIENPPQMNRANAYIMNRFWGVAGRRYQKATPIDFRVVAIGQERYEDADTPQDGKTKFEITVQGMVIREDMQTDVKRLRDDIVYAIQHTPKLEVNLVEHRLYVNEWCPLIGTIENVGNEVAKDIVISATGVKVDRTDIIDVLLPGDIKQFELPVYAENTGSVPVTISATCRDRFGQLPPHKRRQQIQVEEKQKPAVPTIGNQTNFYGPSAGSIHSGSGDIGNSNQ